MVLYASMQIFLILNINFRKKEIKLKKYNEVLKHLNEYKGKF